MADLLIDIIGGAYEEICAFPQKNIYRGSGTRAANFLSSLGIMTSFYTLTDKKSSEHFKRISSKFNYSLQEIGIRKEEISFYYRHPLATPVITPPKISEYRSKAPIKSQRALVFGMLEGTPLVHGDKVVYDPQNGDLAHHFEKNGSSANELAMVLSYSEGKAITKMVRPSGMADSLLKKPNISTVIVKCGPQGALVATEKQRQWVPPFVSSKVYKIGSGDIFSAAFSFLWLLSGKDPFESAWFASKVCAAYVETGVDRFTIDYINRLRTESYNAKIENRLLTPPPIPDTKIYLAGPFFTTSQQWLVDETLKSLQDMGFKVFSPIHEVGIGSPHDLANQDLAALEQSGLVLALIDGCDAGTIFEVGYARAKGIPVVAIAEKEDGETLTMLIGSGCTIVKDYSTGIYKACWKLMGYE